MFHNNQPITATVADIGVTLIQIKILQHFQTLEKRFTNIILKKHILFRTKLYHTHIYKNIFFNEKFHNEELMCFVVLVSLIYTLNTLNISATFLYTTLHSLHVTCYTAPITIGTFDKSL
jgi:hypothetical protein